MREASPEWWRWKTWVKQKCAARSPPCNGASDLYKKFEPAQKRLKLQVSSVSVGECGVSSGTVRRSGGAQRQSHHTAGRALQRLPFATAADAAALATASPPLWSRSPWSGLSRRARAVPASPNDNDPRRPPSAPTHPCARQMLERAMAEGRNIILPDTATNFKFTTAVLQRFKANGYSVVLLFIYASRSSTLKRGAGYEFLLHLLLCLLVARSPHTSFVSA